MLKKLIFREHLFKLIPMLMKPNNLILKKIDGGKVKVKELVQYFKSYINIFTEGELLYPKSIFNVSFRFSF